ncbi:helix-turn-helix domain-containing protein [Rhizobium lentis]|nr:transcriptional regulator [Rhizobium lentis]MBX5179911.1 helix-turn-helix domain-containing protein [Rhizobium lentis]
MSEINHITGRQVAAARALLGIGQVELAKSANISAPTLRRIEDDKGGMKNNVAAVVSALEAAGVAFINNDRGEGVVKLRQAK